MADGIVIEVDGRTVTSAQPFTAREVLRLGGILGDGIVIRVDGGRASRFDPKDPVTFDPPACPAFRTFRGAVHRLIVDGLRWDWGMPLISEVDVRMIGRIAEDTPIDVEDSGLVLAHAELIDLTVVPISRLRSRRPV